MSKLERKTEPLVYKVNDDHITPAAIAPFDLTMDEPTKFYPYELPDLPDYNIGLIVGSSGTGKSLLLSELPGSMIVGTAFHPFYSVVSQMGSTPEEAAEKMYAVGLNSVPKWKLPITALSTGEQHRAYVARHLFEGGCIDEFTSTIDRDVAISLSVSVGRYIRLHDIGRVTFASCHRDIIAPLRPDWIIDTDAGEFKVSNTSAPRWWAEMAGAHQGTIHLQWN